MKNSMTFGIVFLSAVFALSLPAVADESGDKNGDRPNITVRLIDPHGKPVVGADVGVGAWFDEVEEKWRFGSVSGRGSTSDRDGLVEIERQHLDGNCLLARHEKRGLVGIASLDPVDNREKWNVQMHPECRVSGRLKSEQLEDLNQTLGVIYIWLSLDNKFAWSCLSETGSFQFFVPPGTYTLRTVRWTTRPIDQTLVVKAGQRELQVGPIDVPATKLELMHGKPAPELRGVLGWKNSQPLQLSDLRGKAVLLDFWGHWCAPCLGKMPALFHWHDKYHEQGLVIVGIHVDLTDEAIDTAEELDEKLADIRNELWDGRDLPFPIAFVPLERQHFGDDVFGTTYSLVGLDYGLRTFPTTILIDREGKVVGEIDPSEPESADLLQEILRQKSK